VADRVIIVDVRRANTEVSVRDVKQMFGRAGRIHAEKHADVHIVLPHELMNVWQTKLNDPKEYEVLSHLNEAAALVFHTVVHVVKGTIKDEQSFGAWYQKTLDCLQRKNRGQAVPTFNAVASELHKTGCARYDEKTCVIEPRPLGRVCARFYFSPYDVHDWFVNLSDLIDKQLTKDDVCQAWALANVTSAVGWDSDAAQHEVASLREYLEAHKLRMRPGATSRTLAVNHVLSGTKPGFELPEFFTVREDLPRIVGAIGAICSCAKRVWGTQDELVSSLNLRVKYSVPTYLVPLVRLPGIGKTTARELYRTFDITNEKELIERAEMVYREGSPGVKRALTTYKKTPNEEQQDAVNIQSSVKVESRRPVGTDEFSEG
jgi:replicative superfamily II helicase